MYLNAQPNKILCLLRLVEGCADPDLPEGAWLKRDGSGAQIGCKANPQTTWMLKCVRGAWEGEAGVCLLEASAAASRDGNGN